MQSSWLESWTRRSRRTPKPSPCSCRVAWPTAAPQCSTRSCQHCSAYTKTCFGGCTERAPPPSRHCCRPYCCLRTAAAFCLRKVVRAGPSFGSSTGPPLCNSWRRNSRRSTARASPTDLWRGARCTRVGTTEWASRRSLKRTTRRCHTNSSQNSSSSFPRFDSSRPSLRTRRAWPTNSAALCCLATKATQRWSTTASWTCLRGPLPRRRGRTSHGPLSACRCRPSSTTLTRST
mmetsp:Transcript_58477/g.110278  ORF Transcript_58477/g.110278 Transcript_58477/m.110278 type:complete len:233 (-) Transcript_58477:422-1120(-)